MKNLLNIKNIHFFLFGVLILLIPFATKSLSFAIILWLLSGIVLYVRSFKQHSGLKFPAGSIFMILFFLIVSASILWSENKGEALFDIQVKLSLILMPVMMVLNKDFYRNNKNWFLLIFVIANTLAVTVCIIEALNNSISLIGGDITFNTNVPGEYADTNTSPPSYFSYTDFSLFKHPAYFSAYLILSFFIVIEFIRSKFFITEKVKSSIILYAITLIIIISGLFFLQSKAGYITFFVVLAVYSMYRLISKKRIITGIIILAAVTAVSIYWFNNNSRFYYIRNAISQSGDFIEAVNNKQHNFIIERYGIDRISLWIIAGEAAYENLLLGCGAGDVHDVLNKKFAEYEVSSFIENHYNAHNQFIETFLAQGIFGFLIMMLWLFYPFFNKRNYKSGNHIFLIFLIIIAINFFFESMLNSVSGVVFTALFYGFLITSVEGEETGNKSLTK